MAGGDRRRVLRRAASGGWLLPGLAFVAIAGASAGLADRFALEREERGRIEVEVVGEQVARRLATFVAERMSIVAHLAEESFQGAVPGEVYRREALAFVERLPGFQALNWVDADGTIVLVVPEAGNEAALGRDLDVNPDPRVGRALARARSTGRPARTSAETTLYQGGRGFTVYHPSFSPSGELRGFVNAVFRVPELVEACLPERSLRDQFHFEVREWEGPVAYLHGEASAFDTGFVYTRSIDVLDRPWEVRVTPAVGARPQAALLPGILLGGGLVLALATALVLRAALLRHGALRHREEQIRLLLDSTLEGIYGVDASGRCTFANPACAKLLGYDDASELVGCKLHELIHHSRPDGESAIVGACREGRAVHLESERLWRKDGTHFEAEVRAHPLAGEGAPAGAVVTFTDVTARRESEASQRRLTAILEATPDLVGISDRDGRPIYMNRTGREMLGLSPAEALRRNVRENHPAAAQRLLADEAIPTARATGSWTGESALLAADGTEIPISQVVIAHAGEDGEVAYYSTIGRDMRAWRNAEAERELLEAEFHQAQKTESLGLLAGGIAHDFNNLLVAVLGNTTLLLEDLPADSPMAERARVIEASAERAAELTQQLLTYAGRRTVRLVPTDLVELVVEMKNLLGASISKRVELILDLDDQALPVMGDPSQLRQIVMNLLTNGAEAVGESVGSVHIRVGSGNVAPARLPGVVLGDGREPGVYTWIEVEDTGVGMDGRTLDRIFDPFFTTKSSGRGLGLSAVLGIVSSHAGLLSIRSVRGEGTRFRVLLPALEAPVARATETAAPAVRPSPVRAGRILVADDEASVRRVAVESLARAGFETVGVASGEEAVTRLAAEPETFDAALLDLTMTGMDGIQTLQALRALRPELPVVLTSGFDASRTSSSIGAMPRTRFLQKPYRLETLAATLREVIAESLPRR